MRSNTKGLELAASTIVLLIVSVVVLAFAGSLSYKVFCSAEEYSRSVDSQTADRIERLMAGGGGRVVVADNTKTAKGSGSIICGGTAQKTAQFTLGLKNTNPSANSIPLVIEVKQGDRDANNEVQFFPGEGERIDLQKGDIKMLKLLVTPPETTEPQLVYTVKVMHGESVYGAQQLYVNFE